MSLSQRPRIQSLQRLARKVRERLGGEDIAPEAIDPINEKLETAEERLINDMAVYWNGMDPRCGPARGGSSVAPFPSVAITEMIMSLNPLQKRALAIHMGLDQLLAEQSEQAQSGVNPGQYDGYGIKPITKVTFGPRSSDHRSTFSYSGQAVPLDSKVNLAPVTYGDPTQRTVVIKPRVQAGKNKARTDLATLLLAHDPDDGAETPWNPPA